jgi:hypothetical protein
MPPVPIPRARRWLTAILVALGLRACQFFLFFIIVYIRNPCPLSLYVPGATTPILSSARSWDGADPD